jgi:hypothetical protein
VLEEEVAPSDAGSGDTDNEEDTQIVVPKKISRKPVKAPEEEELLWVGKPVHKDQARKFWPLRYRTKEVGKKLLRFKMAAAFCSRLLLNQAEDLN